MVSEREDYGCKREQSVHFGTLGLILKKKREIEIEREHTISIASQFLHK